MALFTTRPWLMVLALAACSSGEERPSTPEPAPAVEEPSAVDPAEPSAVVESPEAACTEGTARSPWSHSVADDDLDEEACANTTHRPGPPCERNSDCGICHDGSSCGRPANRAEIERLGSECCQEDAAECEPFVVRCCAGHCQVTGD